MAAPAQTRDQAVDLVRGLVMALMALDHTRDFFQPLGSNPENLATTTVAFFAMRWVTHFCAPTFVFLAGASARWKADGLPSGAHTTRWLAGRGLWLMWLGPTVINFGWYFGWDRIQLGVVWAIGGAMLLLSGPAGLWRSRPASERARWGAVVGLLGWAGTLAMAALPLVGEGLWRPLLAPMSFSLAGRPVHSVYVVLPWLCVMASGFGLAPLLRARPDRLCSSPASPARVPWARCAMTGTRRSGRWLLGGGLLASALFVCLRWFQWGDPRPWEVGTRGAVIDALGFLNPSKYPPSLLFQLMTLGPMMALLGALRLRPRWATARPLETALVDLGRVPLFYYLIHLPLVHAAGWAYARWRFGLSGIPAEEPLSLSLIVVAWLGALAILWPCCRAWGALKRSRSWWWLRLL